MKYRLLALDLDGTLLDSSGKVPDENLRAVQRARDAGMTIAICTGRGLKESHSAIEALGHDGPLVLANGALIFDPGSGKTIHRAALEPRLSMSAIECLLEGDDAVLVLLDPEVVAHDYLVVRPERLSANTKWWFDFVGATYRGVDRVTEEDLHHAVRVGIVGPASHMPGVQQRVEDRFGSELFIQHFMAVAEDEATGEPVHVLEVFTQGVNKWSALEWVCDRYRVLPEQVVAIGDHINDVEMIEGAGCGVAMGNAVAQVQDVADYQTGTNDTQGVAQAIDRVLSEEW